MTVEAASNENRILAGLGYPIWIVALVVLLTDMKSNRFMRTQAVQALGFNIASWIVIFGLGIIINIVGLWQLYFLDRLAQLAWLVLALVYGYRAYQGQTFDIPVVSQFTAKYAGAEK